MNRKGSVASVADLLLTNSPQAFLVAEGEDLTYVSPGLLTLLRYACRDDVPVPIIALVHADERQQVLEAWKAARAQSSASAPVQTSVTFRCARGDGSYFWAQLTGCTTPSHLYAVLRDISDRKALEESLRGFLACVMGDMRQPLAGVQAASELLAARQCVREDEEARFLVAAIIAACHMLLGIGACPLYLFVARLRVRVLSSALTILSRPAVTNVLSVRSLETGECRAENAPFSVRRMIESVLSVCRMSTAHRTDVNLLWPDEAEAQLPPLMLGDERLLSQCLQNLLTNGACPRC
jgi:signal transduction histidine kinase